MLVESVPASPDVTTSFPRLYARPEDIARLREAPALPRLRLAADAVAEMAQKYLLSAEVPYPEKLHNSLLLRARAMQVRMLTLLAQWRISGESRYRDAAVAHVREMGRWQVWSWMALQAGKLEPDADFDLSCGENCATLAIAFDWLAPTLTPQERSEFLAICRDRGLRPFLKHARPGAQRQWWFSAPNSNWNTVCAGGAGMLALALYHEASEAPEALSLAEESIAPYMHHLQATEGGWPEGIGYWNYGMRYAFMYLLSHESATGRPHPLMEQPATRATLRFPLDFCPNGCSSSFGDVNKWSPLPLHYALARRLGETGIMAALDSFPAREDYNQTTWPDAAELLLFHPGRLTLPTAPETGVLRHYPTLDWCILADRLPSPRMYLAIRGGSTRVPHSHLDLMSFCCVVGDETLIANIGIGEYMETTFSSRRFEIYETTPPSKNVMLINGVGIAHDSMARTRSFTAGQLRCVRVDVSEAMGRSGYGRNAATLAVRLFLMLPQRGFLIVDQVQLPATGRLESRVHTFAAVEQGEQGALLRGERENLAVAYAASVPSILSLAEDALTVVPEDGRLPRMLRWCTRTRTHQSITMATYLAPGQAAASLTLQERGESVQLTLRAGDWYERLSIAPGLESVELT